MIIKSFRIFSQTCVNDASWILAETLPSNLSINFLDEYGNRRSSILWRSPVSLFFTVILIVALSRMFSELNEYDFGYNKSAGCRLKS
jgi:hypothetical protein